MPEFPPPKRLPPVHAVDKPTPPPTMRYAELHCRTNYSFLEGASHGDELVARAAALGYTALAVTDRNSLAGVVRAHAAAKPIDLKLLIGAEITPVDAAPLLVWAVDRAGYGRLSRLLTTGRRAAPKGQCRLTFDDVAGHAAGLLAGVPLRVAGRQDLGRYRETFGDRCYAVAELHRGPEDGLLLRSMIDDAEAARVPLVAANDVHYHEPSRQMLQDVLTAIRLGCSVAELGERIFPNAERHLKPIPDLAALFADRPDVIERTAEVADRCTFSLDELRYDYPEELCPPGTTPSAYLRKLVEGGATRRYPDGLPDKVRAQIEHELSIIGDLHYEAYFLTVWDLVRFARERKILCQGRGSAANSAVCFCLGVTEVDPGRIDVLFERFISRERNEAPDIDVDFEHERREEVLQYVYEKYGRERSGMTGVVITYRTRSAMRDVGKALGFSQDRIDVVAKTMDHHHDEEQAARRFGEAGLDPESPLARLWIAAANQIVGFPRHLSQHTGGMVITNGPLCELVPIENAAMPDRTVVEWDKDDLDALGILKVDCLALGMLSALRKCFDLVAAHYDRPLTLATVPAEDPVVYDMICRADTMGVFQIESRAQMSMLPRLRPRRFYDLVIEVAIVRPGPIQGDMVHPYLRRRAGDEPVAYPNDAVREVLQKTLGVPIFQEQAMRLVVVAAGFSPGEADQLRRAMGAFRRRGVMERFRQKFMAGMAANGYSTEFAEQVFRQLQGFGEYGFPESHAASFALLVYASSWLKCYYPAAFAAALVNSQPMGFYAPAQLIADAHRHGVVVRPIDVNSSRWDCTLEPTATSESAGETREFAIRLGFRLISGLREATAQQIEKVRQQGPFTSFDDFAHRTGFSAAVLKNLAHADVFRSVELDRRSALWRSLPSRDSLPLFDHLDQDEVVPALPAMSAFQEVLADYATSGLSLRQHPMAFIRDRLDALGVVPAKDLANHKTGRRIKAAGVVLLRQRPSTANGITFVTLEDEGGVVNLIVRREVWERCRRAARGAGVMLAHGRLQILGMVIHVLVEHIDDLSLMLGDLDARSRDFR